MFLPKIINLVSAKEKKADNIRKSLKQALFYDFSLNIKYKFNFSQYTYPGNVSSGAVRKDEVRFTESLATMQS